MPVKKTTRQIGDLTFHSQPLAPFDVLELQADVGDLIGRALAGGDGPSGALSALRGKFKTIMPKLLEGTSVDGLPECPKGLTLNSVDSITTAFYGRMELLPEVVKLVAEVSFLPFLKGLGKLMPGAETDDLAASE